ncbi:MAG: phage portal protein [Mogibacterium sp.]|nr:phage portal protein [Mogibacterium sp.]MCF0232932.1 phage portal protein [Enterococcus sp.]
MALGERLQHAWNAFRNKDPSFAHDYGVGYSRRPDRPRLTRGYERSIVTSVINRFSVDAASIKIKHVRLDESERYIGDCNTSLNDCLTTKANKDQTGRAFIQDVVMSMLNEGAVAIVPIDTNISIVNNNTFDILSMRTAKIVEWFPDHIKVNVYNDRTGKHEEIILPKKNVAIVENPFYSIMNEPNSTMQRLVRKLNLLDDIDEQSGSGKLDLIIQLPYVIKSQARREQAEARRNQIEEQLANSKFGIAYSDATEHITQLNRPIENNLMTQVEYLTNMFYSQMGITTEVLNGSADPQKQNNYMNSIIEPILTAITDSMKVSFLTKTARTQGQSICFFMDPFKLAAIDQIAEIADKLTRNEIMSSNEVRQKLGMRPSEDPKADMLNNSNISDGNTAMMPEEIGYDEETEDPYAENYNSEENPFDTPVSEINV